MPKRLTKMVSLAAWALSRVSGRADLLAPLLEHDDDGVRLAAVDGMLWTGHDPAKLLPTLLVSG